MSEGSAASEIYIGLGGGGAPEGPRQSLVLKRANRHGLIAVGPRSKSIDRAMNDPSSGGGAGADVPGAMPGGLGGGR